MQTQSSQPAVELNNATKNFGSVQALKGVSLKVEQGETVAFLGPNGAGKTTAISLMLGLRSPTSGSAALFGQNPRNPANRSRIGVMLQESGVPTTLKVREVVEMFRRLYPQPLTTLGVLDAAQLTDKANALTANLSGGQRQRLYFALALIGNPDVLFLDEPTVALDVESRRIFWHHISGMIKGGKTVVLTTHYLEEADALAQRIVVINQGTIVAEGTPREIKARVGGKNVRFRSTTLTDAALHGLPHVERATRTADLVEIYTLKPEIVLGELFRNNVEINELEVVGAGLEEAFVSITNQGSN